MYCQTKPSSPGVIPSTQADTDLLSDRRSRMDEWREWADGRRAWRDQLAAAAQKIIEARYQSAEDPDDYTVQQVGSCFRF